MIWDSSPWKFEVARVARDLERRRAQKQWREASLARVERDVMVAFYMVRKLMEAKKLTDELAGRSLTLRLHRRIGRMPDHLNWHHLERFFDLDHHSSVDRGLKFVCDQVVHSYIFVTCTGEHGGLDGFYLASDRARSGGLFYLSVPDAVSVLRAVASDAVVSARYQRRADGQFDMALVGPTAEALP